MSGTDVTLAGAGDSVAGEGGTTLAVAEATVAVDCGAALAGRGLSFAADGGTTLAIRGVAADDDDNAFAAMGPTVAGEGGTA